MEVIVAGPEKVVVELSHEEFLGLTGVRVGDYYGNSGVAPDAMPGMKFDLKKALDAIFDLKCVFEVRERIKKDMVHVASKLDGLTFPLVSFKDTKAVEMKRGRK